MTAKEYLESKDRHEIVSELTDEGIGMYCVEPEMMEDYAAMKAKEFAEQLNADGWDQTEGGLWMNVMNPKIHEDVRKTTDELWNEFK